ncbi:protein pigeon isoform X2 [Culicoides brevitarsis]|uniref:protein pigeon isoform X2 n=1 Tax=Culicoides brevitarsis TaxID=469753 RepID=UPI00307B643C
MLKQENLAANLYGLLAQKQKVHAIEWRILGQEQDGSLLASWVTKGSDKQFSNIGHYNVKEKSFDVLFSFEKRENIVQATVNQSKTLLVFVIKDQIGSETNKFTYKATLTEINNANPKPPMVLQERSCKQIMTQFLWGKAGTFAKKNQDRFLLMVHEENVLLFTATFKKSDKVLEEQLKDDRLRTDRIDYTRPDGWHMDQNLLRKETIVRNFSWAQFDPQIQALYYIHVKQPTKSLFDLGDSSNNASATPNVTPTLSALQFHDDLPTETVLNIPLNLPKIPNSADECYEDDTIPLRVHDSSLNLIIVSDESGMIFVCHYYLYQPIKQADEDSSKSGVDDVHFAYSVTTLHHGCVIHCVIPGIPWEKARIMKPTFTLHGDHHMLVFQSDLFMHLLDVGLSHEPCCHLVCPPFTRHSVSHLVPVFKANNIAFDTATLDLISIKIPKAHLIEAFRNDTSLDNRLSIVHYFLAHSNDIDIFSELLNIIMERPLSLDTVPLLKEALISGAYSSSKKGLPTDALALLTLLPLTTSNISKPLHAKVLNLSVGLSHETLHNTTMMLLSPQQRLSPYRTDLWTKCYEKLNENKDWKRFVPDQVTEKLMYSLVAYQPEALSRCTTPMSPSTQFVGASFSDLATISACTSSNNNATRRNPYDALPFLEIETCTASKQEHVISVNLRELSMHLVKYSVKQVTGFRWLKDSFLDRNPAPTHVHAVATRYATAQLELSRALCTLICRSAGVDARVEQDRGFTLIDKLPSQQQFILFAMLERYCLAVDSLAFPLPQGFASFFSYLGYRAQSFDMFLDYVHRHVFELQIDVMKQIMQDIPDTKEGVKQKLSLLSTLPRSRAKRLLNNWNHPQSLILRGRDHASSILSGNPVHPKSSAKRRVESLDQMSSVPAMMNQKLTYLDSFLDLLTAKASLNEIDYNLLIESTMASLQLDAENAN